jgi:DNA polymerase I-like protein with 3'-5' exonuclease and polymerase domains
MRKPILVIDIESTGTNWRRDRLHGVGLFNAHAWDEPLYATADSNNSLTRGHLADPKTDKLGHNITFDVKFLRQAGFEVRGRLWDTRKIAHLLDENGSTGLKELTRRYLGEDRLQGKTELDQLIESTGSGHVGNLCAKDLLDPSRPHTPTIAKYCLEDVQNTWDLFQVLIKKLKDKHVAMKKLWPKGKTILDYYLEIGEPFDRAQVEIELPGVRVDMGRIVGRQQELRQSQTDTLEALNKTLSLKIEAIRHHFAERALEKKLAELKNQKKIQEYKDKGTAAFLKPFDWNKGGHVERLFFNEMRLPTQHLRKTKTGKVSLDNMNVQALLNVCHGDQKAIKVLEQYASYKETAKLLNTFIGAPGKKGLLSHVQQQDGSAYVYPSYGDYLVTGRLSCSNPNTQQIPRGSGIKSFFVPHQEGNVFVHGDASQVELRIAAHLSQDPEMLRAYHDGEDLHRMTAAAFFEKDLAEVTDDERQAGKAANFLLIFGGSPGRLQAQLLNQAGRKFSLEECKGFIRAFELRYPVYQKHLKRILADVERRRCVVSETGRVRRLPDIQYGAMLDRDRRRFKGPKDFQRLLEEELGRWAKGKQRFSNLIEEALKRAKEQGDDYVYTLASLKYAHAKKQAYNFPVQHLGAVMTKRAIFALQKAGHVVRSTVHDSIDVELPVARLPEVPAIKRMMETAYPLSVPILWELKVLRSFDEKDLFNPDEE